MDISGEFWTRFDHGRSYLWTLLCVGLFLMFKGATKIKILSFLTGCAMAMSSTFLFDEIGSMASFSEGDFTLAVTFACGVVMFMAIGLMSQLLQGTSHCKPCCGLYPCWANGYDVGTN